MVRGLVTSAASIVTSVLANLFSDDATSPFSRTQLVQVADATRDYAFASHDKAKLYRTIYEVDRQYEDDIEKGGGSVNADFPRLDIVSDPGNPEQTGAAFATASEQYCYPPATVAHLD